MAKSSFSPAPEGAIPQTRNMDPLKADAGTSKPRRTKLRKQLPPHADMAAWKAEGERRVKARPTHAMIMLEPAGFDREHMVPLHNDERLHDLQLAEAFGTRSYAVMWTFLRQLEELCCDKWWDEETQQFRLDEQTFNTMLALIGSLKPRNEMEAAFAAQIAAVHMLNMKLMARAIRYDYDTKTVAVAGKLAGTFAMQMDTWRALRGKSRTAKQLIKVTKETHYHVHQHDARGVGETGGQSHGRSDERNATAPEIADERAALPGSDEGGRVVPLPRRPRSA